MHGRAEAEALEYLVRPSVPILFFGDSDSYRASRIRALTVGLNPSREEFPRADPFSRFECPRRVDGSPDIDLAAYLRTLNEYFRLNPYRQWFDPSFEPLLSGLGASYYGGGDSTALHTDLCTPLATDPTWSRLKPGDRDLLRDSGRRLWHDLVEALEPDLVLVSIQRALAETIEFSLVEDLGVVFELDGPRRARPYRLEAARRSLHNGKVATFVFGQASQTPFGSVSANDKRLMGARLRERAENR
ncbi:MAG: hypothetical protein ACHQC8_01655 [Solirubrobacterales bacterium]